uniref:Bulb-type lectin domain-containing protein n=1 Tax=Caldilinea aerophila TaxID=133453 RepID=A0A7C1JKR6_9CHLR
MTGQTFYYTDYRTGATHSYGLLLKVDKYGDVLSYWQLEDGVAQTSISALLATDDGSVLIWGGADTGAVLARLDTSGTVTWKQGYDFPENSGASAILQTPDGGFLLVGSTFLPGPLSGYAVKISSIGDIQWSRAYPINFNLPNRLGAGFNEVDLTSDGGFLMAGDVWPGPITGNPDYDLYVVWTDAAGNSCNSKTVAAPTPTTPNLEVSSLSAPATSAVSLIIGTPNTQSSNVVTQSADLCRYLLYLPMAVKTP